MKETTMEKHENLPKLLAVFGANYKLLAVFRSIKEASNLTGIVRQSIIKAVNGDMISIRKCYWRLIPEELILDTDDIGELTLFDFDKEAGTPDYRIYSTKRMRRLDIIMESKHKN